MHGVESSVSRPMGMAIFFGYFPVCRPSGMTDSNAIEAISFGIQSIRQESHPTDRSHERCMSRSIERTDSRAVVAAIFETSESAHHRVSSRFAAEIAEDSAHCFLEIGNRDTACYRETQRSKR